MGYNPQDIEHAITRLWSVSQSAPLRLRKSSTFECHLLSINTWSIWLWVLPLGEVQVFFMNVPVREHRALNHQIFWCAILTESIMLQNIFNIVITFVARLVLVLVFWITQMLIRRKDKIFWMCLMTQNMNISRQIYIRLQLVYHR